MCGHHFYTKFTLAVTAVLLVLGHSLADVSGQTGGSCQNRFETAEFANQVRDCLAGSDKMVCLKNVLRSKIREKALLKKIKDIANVTISERDPACVNSDFKNLLLYIDKNKKELEEEIGKFLRRDGVSVDLDSNVALTVRSSGNETIDIKFKFTDVMERKMKMNKNNILAMLFTPAMVVAGIMPWVLPGVKMAVMIVTMMNQVAFSSALFSLIRGYIFDSNPDEHIIYINNGYKNYKPHAVRVHQHR